MISSIGWKMNDDENSIKKNLTFELYYLDLQEPHPHQRFKIKEPLVSISYFKNL
jgi:hypothetical protein